MIGRSIFFDRTTLDAIQRVSGAVRRAGVPMEFGEQVTPFELQPNPDEALIFLPIDAQVQVSRVETIEISVLAIVDRNSLGQFTHRLHPANHFPTHRQAGS
jgi:hypothetical protein